MARDDEVLAFLGRLADSFCETADDRACGVLLRVAAVTDGLEVGVLDLQGPPAETLLGSVAPDEWVALGVAAGGWAHPLDVRPAGGPAPGHSRHRRRTSSAVLVHRSGAVVSRLRVGDDEVIDDPPAYGLTLDGLQRALGLPTAPPLITTGDLFAGMWLENVVVAAEERGSLPWAQARALHPAVRMLAGQEPVEGPVEGSDDPVAAGRALARVCDWEHLRWETVEGRWPVPPLTPTDAAWCDTGAFSRWVMAGRPGIDDLLEEVKRAAGSGVSRRSAAVLRRLGVLGRGRTAA